MSPPRWTVRGDAALLERERAWLAAVRAEGRARVERRVVAGRACFAKASALAGRAAVRHAARAAAGLPLPRLAERENLLWLRAHGFGAPEPLVAAAAWSGALPRFQVLYTAAVDGVPTLAELLDGGDPRAEPAALELARVAARLHARGFVHRDLFARNVLVRAADDLVLLDAWRGGARRGLRGPRWDLGCLVHDVARLGGGALAGPLVAAYADESARRGRARDPANLRAAAERVGRRLDARAARRARVRARRARRRAPR